MPVANYLRLSLNHVPHILLWQPYAMMEGTRPPIALQSSYHGFPLKKISLSFSYLNSLRFQTPGALHIRVDVRKFPVFFSCLNSTVSIDSTEVENFDEEAQIEAYYSSLDSQSEKDCKERERRRKIGLSNKGKVPWNRGRKHTAETCARIKQRTIEALRDPKVRTKMAEHPRAHSDESKARIGSALRHVWAKRLRWKQLGEKFILSWSESIAKAAKDGWSDQQELDWDSYSKIKQEMAEQQLQLAADKAKAKEMAKIIAAKAALEKAQKMARLAEKRKEREEKAKARREIKRKAGRKSKKNEGLSVSQGLILKQRLTKIHKKKSITVPVTIQGNMLNSHMQTWEKLDIDLIKKEKLQREVSLEDQIRAAKHRKAESMAEGVLAGLSSFHHFSTGSEN